jgi:hypothetical protein
VIDKTLKILNQCDPSHLQQESNNGEPSSKTTIIQQCIECLGNIASSDLTYRDQILRNELFLPSLQRLTAHPADLSATLLPTLCWLFSVMTRGQPIPKHRFLQSLVHMVVMLLMHVLSLYHEDVSTPIGRYNEALEDLFAALSACCELQPLPIYTANVGNIPLTADGQPVKTHVSCVGDVLATLLPAGKGLNQIFLLALEPTTTSNSLRRSCITSLKVMICSAEANELLTIARQSPLVAIIDKLKGQSLKIKKEMLSILRDLILNIPIHDLQSIVNCNHVLVSLQDLSMDDVADADIQDLTRKLSNHFSAK